MSSKTKPVVPAPPRLRVDRLKSGRLGVTHAHGIREVFDLLPAGETSGVLFRYEGQYWRRVKVD